MMTRQGLHLLYVACAMSLITLAWAPEVQAQCDWRADYANYKVRSVSFRLAELFGGVPEALKQQLAAHRGDLYTSEKPNKYVNEVIKFLDNDPAAVQYEKLVAKKLKFSFKAFQYRSCVRQVEPADCSREFNGIPGSPVTQCMDVVVERRGLAADALNTAPYLVLFPRSTLVKLLAALPRPLMALNPGLGLDFDGAFGASAAIDTSTDLLDLGGMFKKSSAIVGPATRQPSATPAPQPTPIVSAPGEVQISAPQPGLANPEPAEESPTPEPQDLSRDTKLLLHIKGQKSADKSFYNTETGLLFSRTKALSRLQNLLLETNFVANKGPHGAGTFLENSVTAGGGADLRVKIGPFRLVNLSGKYRWSSNRFFSGASAPELTSENAVEGRFIADGNLKKGLLRLSAWFDSAKPSARPDSYQRLAAILGYSKEFVISRKKTEFHKIQISDGTECFVAYDELPKTNDPAIGAEIIAGVGHAWGNLPEYARFYGGNSSANFLYDEPSSQTLTAFPAGPLLRSAERQQAGVPTNSNGLLGATSYWHLNANVSLPISGWSQPLIPAEFVGGTFPEGDEKQKVPADALVCRDLKYQIKNQVNRGGKELLLARVARDSLSKAQQDALRLNPRDPNLTAAQQQALIDATAAYKRAKEDHRVEVEQMMREEITPITDFIADHADIYSIKPLLMFDAARLSSAAAITNRTRYGFGGGLQVNVVTVRLEAGYLHAVNRLPGDKHGNFVFRLIFRRFY